MPTAPKRPCTTPRCPNLQPCPDHQRMYDTRRGSAAKRGYSSNTGSTWQQTRRIVLARDPICTWTEPAHGAITYSRPCTSPSVDVAHIVPRSRGGSDDPSNLRGLCHRHHSQETATGESFGRGKA